MPDQDRFERGLASGWRKVYRLVKGGIASEAELVDASMSALAHSLRQSGGCPGLQDVAGVLQRFTEDQSALQSPSATNESIQTKTFKALRRIEWQQGEPRTTKIAVRAAMSIVAQLSRQNNYRDSQAQLGHMLSEQVCLGLVDHYFFGRTRGDLVRERFSTFHEARAWEQSLKKAMNHQMQKLASRLWKDPIAARIRAPKRIVGRRSTWAILNDSLIG